MTMTSSFLIASVSSLYIGDQRPCQAWTESIALDGGYYPSASGIVAAKSKLADEPRLLRVLVAIPSYRNTETTPVDPNSSMMLEVF